MESGTASALTSSITRSTASPNRLLSAASSGALAWPVAASVASAAAGSWPSTRRGVSRRTTASARPRLLSSSSSELISLLRVWIGCTVVPIVAVGSSVTLSRPRRTSILASLS